jgi:hypothetical protein
LCNRAKADSGTILLGEEDEEETREEEEEELGEEKLFRCC